MPKPLSTSVLLSVLPSVRRFPLAAAALVAAVASVPATALAGPFSSMYVFGDSLSDPGNLFALTGSTFPPSPPYFNGRLSDGRVAVEYLADSLELSSAQVANAAIAGARTGADGQVPGTGLASQVSGFLAVAPLLPPLDTSLFVVWAGANDFRDSLLLADPTSAWSGIYGQLASAVSQLYTAGARQFLLPNLPDVGLTPEGLASGISPIISQLAGGFNTGLAATYGGLQAALPGSVFRTVDVFRAQQDLVAGAAALGITNLEQGCLVPVPTLPVAPSACANSFYVDNIHPTTLVHAAIGQAMLAAAVPEPGSMLLVATAVLGLVGASARRRRPTA